MDIKQKIINNMALFMATYLKISGPNRLRIPKYEDDEEVWTEFLKDAIKEYIDRQPMLDQMSWVEVPKMANLYAWNYGNVAFTPGNFTIQGNTFTSIPISVYGGAGGTYGSGTYGTTYTQPWTYQPMTAPAAPPTPITTTCTQTLPTPPGTVTFEVYASGGSDTCDTKEEPTTLVRTIVDKIKNVWNKK